MEHELKGWPFGRPSESLNILGHPVREGFVHPGQSIAALNPSATFPKEEALCQPSTESCRQFESNPVPGRQTVSLNPKGAGSFCLSLSDFLRTPVCISLPVRKPVSRKAAGPSQHVEYHPQFSLSVTDLKGTLAPSRFSRGKGKLHAAARASSLSGEVPVAFAHWSSFPQNNMSESRADIIYSAWLGFNVFQPLASVSCMEESN